MRKSYFKAFLFIAIISLTVNSVSAQGPVFTVASPNGNYTLTCSNTPITMVATNSVPVGPFSYTWTIPGNTLTGNYINAAQVGTWTVTCQNTVTSASSTQTFLISQNLTSPAVVVTPTVQNIICSSASSCFTATCNQGPNVTTNWFLVAGTNTMYVGVAQGTINIFCPTSPGLYWFEAKNNVTGCATTKSVMVTSSVGVPIFTVTSPTNFTVGCTFANITSMQVSTVITSPTPNGTCTYTFVPPAAASATPTTFTINPNQNNIATPGIWVVYVNDLTNNCISSQSISIIQNTMQPNIDFIQPLSILNCNNPSMVMNGISSNTNTSITWTIPAIPSPSVNPTPNATITINSAVVGASVNITSIGVFTVGAVDNNNFCRSSTTVQIIQDIRKPAFIIVAASNSIITCINTDVLLVPMITPSLAVALVPTYEWFPPVGPSVLGSQFNTTAAGTHSAISMSSTNGCTIMATYNVAIDNVVAASDQNYATSCPINTILISPVYSSTIGLTYAWSGPASAITSATNQSTIIGNAAGVYSCIVTNTVNGCSKTVTCTVACNNGFQANSLDNSLRVFPNPSNGKINIEMNRITTLAKISFYDMQGKVLLEKELKEKTNAIDLEFAKGYYFYKIMEGNTMLKNDKLIIE